MNQVLFQSLDKTDSKLPKAGRVYELLRDEIIAMRLAPGLNLQEKEICSQLGISRTPLREALLQLAAEGLVRIVPSGGTFVAKIVLREVLAGQLIRETAEMQLVRLAARNFGPEYEMDFELNLFKQKATAARKQADDFFALDNEFHRIICTASGFPTLWNTIHSATGQLDRTRRQAFPIEEHFKTVYDEHREIYDRLRAKDEDGAAEIFHVQLESTFPSLELLRERFPELIEEGPDFDVASIR
jgi:DNA-binding GntR family transcriptional regulator